MSLLDEGDDNPTSGGVIHYQTIDVLPGLDPVSPTASLPLDANERFKMHEEMKSVAVIASSTPISEEDKQAANEILSAPEDEQDEEVAKMMNDIFSKYESQMPSDEETMTEDEMLEKIKEILQKANSDMQQSMIEYLRNAKDKKDFEKRTKSCIRSIATSIKNWVVKSTRPIAFYSVGATAVAATMIPLPYYPNGLIDWTDPFGNEDFSTWVEQTLNIYANDNIAKFTPDGLAIWIGGILSHVIYSVVQHAATDRTSMLDDIVAIAYTAVWPVLAADPANFLMRTLTFLSNIRMPTAHLDPETQIIPDAEITGLQQCALNNSEYGDEEFTTQLMVADDPTTTITTMIQSRFPDSIQYTTALVAQNAGAVGGAVHDMILGEHATPASVINLFRDAVYAVTGITPGNPGGAFQIPAEVHAVAEEVNAAMGVVVYLMETSKAVFNAGLKALSPAGLANFGLMLTGTATAANGLLTGNVAQVQTGGGVVLGSIGGLLQFLWDIYRARN